MTELDDKRQSGQLAPSWRLWPVFVICALTVLATVTVYVQTQPTEFTARAAVALHPKGARPVSADVVLLTAPRYVSLATSPFVINQVAQQSRIAAKAVTAGTSVAFASDDATLTVSVTLKNRKATAVIANAIADTVVRRVGTDPLLAAETLSSAAMPHSPNEPNRLPIIGAGAVVAVVVGGCAAWLFSRHMRRRAAVVRGVATVDPPERAAK